MHNNYTSAENKNVDEIRIKFLGLFDSIIFYSGDNKQSLNKSLCKVKFILKRFLSNFPKILEIKNLQIRFLQSNHIL